MAKQELELPKEGNSYLKNLSTDIPAGLVVFLVALPLCLGIALASGTSLFSGLISGIVGGMVVSWLSGSQISISGPAAGLAVIVAMSIDQLNSFPGFLVAVVLSGVMQIIMGLVRAGTISNYFPTSVIKGMLSAIGVILILKQIPHAFGYDADFEGDFSFFQTDNENSFTEILIALNKTHPGAMIISALSLIILIAWDYTPLKNSKVIKAPLIVVVLGILINIWFMNFNDLFALRGNHVVNIPVAKSARDFFTFFVTPDWKYITRPKVWEVAVTIAIAASLQSLLTIDALDKIDPEKRTTPPNRELLAQGVGNIVSGLIGGLPVISEIVRSSVNLNANAKTKVSGFTHGLLLSLSVLFLPLVLNKIPLSCLAAILIMVGFRLIRPAVIKSVYQAGWSQFIPFVITIFAILFTDLLKGIGIGMITGLFFIIKREFDKGIYLFEEEGRGSKLKVYMLTEEVSFLSKAKLLKELGRVPKGSKLLIDGTRSRYIDYDVLEALKDFKEKAKKDNIKVEFINIQDSY